jgi:hypothetical protein
MNCLNCDQPLVACEAARSSDWRLPWTPCALCGGTCNPCRPRGNAGCVEIEVEIHGEIKIKKAHRFCAAIREQLQEVVFCSST